MSYTECKLFIEPERDTGNSHPHEIEFTCTCEGKISIFLDGNREITFTSSDFNKIIKLSDALKDD